MMQRFLRPIFVLCFALLLPAAAVAQQPRIVIAAKGGVSAESSEDNLKGSPPALGLTGGVHFESGWRAEVEFWLPDYIDDTRGNPKHRDILLSFSALKSFGAGRARPFVVMGFSASRTQDIFSICLANRPVGSGGALQSVQVSCDEPDVVSQRREENTGNDGYLLGGGGVEIDLTRHLGIVADVRLSLAPVSVIARPGVGLVFKF